MHQSFGRLLFVGASGALLSCSLLQSASAQETVEEIVVTGSSIRGVAPVGSPVVSMGNDDILSTGRSTTTEVLRSLPQLPNLGADESHLNQANNANANVTYGSGINLRGLGTEATLTLVNGNRAIPSGTQSQYVDPSMIPIGAIERVEVLLDGASAIYGSDAVGGVVNIILRKNFNGAETRVRYGEADGLDQVVFSQVFGKTWGSGDVMFAYEHNERSNLPARKRKLYTDDLRPYGGTDQRSFFGAPGNIQIGNTRYAIPYGQDGTNLTPADLVPGTANRFSIYEGADALPSQDRDTFALTFEQDLTDSLSLFFEGYYAERTFERLTPLPSSMTANLTVPSTNPWFVHPTNPAATSVNVNYAFVKDYGANYQAGYSRLWQPTLGLRWDLPAGWRATLSGSYGEDKEKWQRDAVNVAVRDAALADPNPATAFNPFGDGSYTNPETLARMKAYYFIASEYALKQANARFDGPLFELPGGIAKLAVGASYYGLTAKNKQQDNLNTPNPSIHQVTAQTEDSRTVRSAFAELYVPIVGDGNAMPGVQSLGVSLAGRYDDYSDFGSTTNPKIGVEWRLAESLLLSGSYGKSFRAPVLFDMNPRSNARWSAQNFVDPTSPTGQTRGLLMLGGTAGLGPEEATTWSTGLTWTPVDNLRIALTYYNIDYDNRIATPGNIANPLTQEAIIGEFIRRNPTTAEVLELISSELYFGDRNEDPANFGVIVDGRRKNVARLKTNGVDFSSSYAWQSGENSFNAALNAAYVLSFKRAQTRTVPMLEEVDTINNPLRLQARGQFGWARGPLTTTAFLNYFGDYKNNQVAGSPEVDDYMTLDLSVSYDLGSLGSSAVLSGLSLALNVQDVLDEEPPVVLNGNLAFDPQVASTIGRFISLEVRKRW
jgi:iron complex outermembrane receptor protein